jgi:type III secretion system low calcium response chaperone LcrH/SycD
MLQDLLESNKTEGLTDEAIEQFYTYGYAQYKFGNTLQAIEVFRRLCASKPFESRFWFALGACCQESKQYEPAMKAWSMAAITEPSDPYPHFHAAECASSLQEFEQANVSLNEAGTRVAKEKNHPLQQRISALKEGLAAHV